MRTRFRALTVSALLVTVLLLIVQDFAAAETLKEKVREFQLDNGMTFLVVERREAPVAQLGPRVKDR